MRVLWWCCSRPTTMRGRHGRQLTICDFEGHVIDALDSQIPLRKDPIFRPDFVRYFNCLATCQSPSPVSQPILGFEARNIALSSLPTLVLAEASRASTLSLREGNAAVLASEGVQRLQHHAVAPCFRCELRDRRRAACPIFCVVPHRLP